MGGGAKEDVERKRYIAEALNIFEDVRKHARLFQLHLVKGEDLLASGEKFP